MALEARGAVALEAGTGPSEGMYETLIHHAPDVMLIVDADLRLSWASANIRQLLGYDTRRDRRG